jgi:hypothetical protein
MKNISVALSVLSLLFISSAASGGEEIIYSGTFARGNGKPVPAIEVFAGNAGLANIRLINGGTEDDIGEKVRSFVVKLNGKAIFNSSNFNKNVATLVKEINIPGNNVLEVLLKGKPGAEIAIQITQYVSDSLTVLMNGTGSGRVTSSPIGIFCETDCKEAYDSGTQVTLTAAPYSGSVFAGWSGGGCSGTGSCTLTISGDTSVTANFNLSASDTVTLFTPYVYESDMEEIRDVYSSDNTISPPGRVHDGIDIYPLGNLKPFQAACSGRVDIIYTFSDQVTLFIACNPTYTIEYNFESQAPLSGQTQLDNIEVVEGQTVSQGEIIGYLYDADPDAAHVHFTFHKNWIPTCPEPFFDPGAVVSIENLIIQNLDMCYGPDVTPPALVTPYVNELDMKEINAGFSSDDNSPWGFVHDGIDIYPQGDLKAFQAACSGIVDSVELRQAGVDSNWQVDVLIQCDDYVPDPSKGGYFIPFSVDYVFEPMSNKKKDGRTQLDDILVGAGDNVSQGEIIGYLEVVGEGAHVHFGLLQFGSSAFSAFGITSIPLCPEPHFSTEANVSILNLLHAAWPSAGMCYQK